MSMLNTQKLSLSERLQPQCESSDVTSEECLLQQQLGDFWNLATDLQHRYGHCNNNKENEDFQSLEKEFLYQDFLSPIPNVQKIQRKKTQPKKTEPENRVLRGEDIRDVPTTYVISGLQPHEIPVIGTYVDRRIVPGFRYLIRLNQSPKYLFEGRALHLTSVNIGYGKRLTFESGSKNCNENYFWSDSRPEGYAFATVALQAGDRLTTPDGSQALVVSRVLSQRELTSTVDRNGYIYKTIETEFAFESKEVKGQDVVVRGVAHLVKGKRERRCRLERVQINSGPILELRPKN